MNIRMWMMGVAVLMIAGMMLKQVNAQKAPADAVPEAAVAPAAAMAPLADAPADAVPVAANPGVIKENAPPAEEVHEANTFIQVITRSGFFGITIWICLLASSIAAVTLAIDSFIRIRAEKIAPPALIVSVKDAMASGDLQKAMQACADHQGSLANILSTGFNNIREGFEIIQDAVGVAADIETEKLMQKVYYLNVLANVTPMLGLLGTVQGMIYAFGTLATMQAGAAQQSMLANNISHGLWATAVGLGIALPSLTVFTVLKNKATSIILTMEALTLDTIKGLKNVELVEE